MKFYDALKERWKKGLFVCVGLDVDPTKMPEFIGGDVGEQILKFNMAIIKRVHDFVCAFKPNVAFYEKYGIPGLNALHKTIGFIKAGYPDIPVILDAKRADIGKTNTGYVGAAYDFLDADAITLNPYFGEQALEPFLELADKGAVILCRTSNPGAGEIQDRKVLVSLEEAGDLVESLDFVQYLGWESCGRYFAIPMYQYVALRVSRKWNKNSNCALVAGATYPEELGIIRQLIGNMPLLIPGIGTQGGDVEKTVKAGKDSKGQGMIINSSSGILYASRGDDFADAARAETIKLTELINSYR